MFRGLGKIYSRPSCIYKCMEKQNFKIVLSQNAIQWIYDYGTPVANYQFIGYIFPLFYGVSGVLSIDGSWGVCSYPTEKNPNPKPLTKRKANKFIKQMLRQGILVKVEDSPFSEFEYYNNIKIDLVKIKYLNEKLFDNLGD